MGDSEDKWSDPRQMKETPEECEKNQKKITQSNNELTSMFCAVLIELDKEGRLREVLDKAELPNDINIGWFWSQYKNGYFDWILLPRLQSKTYFKKRKPDHS